MTIVALYAEAFVGPGFTVRPNTPVTILEEDGVTPADLFSDPIGTPGPNPVTSNDLGNLQVRLEPGRYRMQADGAVSDIFEVPLPASAMGALKGQNQYIDEIAPLGFTGTVDCTAAYNAALAALPVAVDGFHYGAIKFGTGTYQVTVGGTVNTGPHVYVDGPGAHSCTIKAVGPSPGHGIYMHGKCLPTGADFSTGVYFGAGVRGLTIDCSAAPAGTRALDIGDLEEPELRVCIRDNTGAGSVGLYLVNRFSWTEKAHGKVMLLNNTRGIVFDVVDGDSTTIAAASNGVALPTASITLTSIPDSWASSGRAVNIMIGGVPQTISYTNITGTTLGGCTGGAGTLATGQTATNASSGPSHAYDDLAVTIYCNEGQDGIVVDGGANPYGGRHLYQGNMQRSTSPASNAWLRMGTKGPAGHINDGVAPTIGLGEWTLLTETVGSGTNYPYTIFRTQGGSIIASGVWRFGGQWQPSNVTTNPNSGFIRFTGQIYGDANLNSPANAGEGNPCNIGAFLQNRGLQAAGACSIQNGDYFTIGPLTANLAVSFSQAAVAVPQRKVFIVTQAASTGPWAVTWPSNIAPTVTAPNFVFLNSPGGVAPTMPTDPGATLVVEAWTTDGATWFCNAMGSIPTGNYSFNGSLAESFIGADVPLGNLVWTDITSLTLTAGTWLITGTATVNNLGGGSLDVDLVLTPTSAGTAGAYAGVTARCQTADWSFASVAKKVVLGATTTIYLDARLSTGGNPTAAKAQTRQGVPNASGLTALRVA